MSKMYDIHIYILNISYALSSTYIVLGIKHNVFLLISYIYKKPTNITGMNTIF